LPNKSVKDYQAHSLSGLLTNLLWFWQIWFIK